jgi:uncharacterized protein YndB with AHSA1/START domain
MTNSDGMHEPLVIECTFDAPVDLVWQMWTDPEHFKVWYGPDGASIPVAELDVRVGGARRVCIEVQTPKGRMRMWFTGEHREIDPPVRLVYTESMADEKGMPSSAADHSGVTEVQVELEEVDGRTKMRLTHVGIPAGSPGAAGWTMAIAKLAARLDASAVR